MKKGFDANKNLSKFAKCLKTKGYDFVCRYYNINNPSKNLTYEEAVVLSHENLGIVAVWENGYPTTADYFSFEKGKKDGKSAYEYALTVIKQSYFTPIYFAVDYDAKQSDINTEITEYFKGVFEGFKELSGNKPLYFIGSYGSGAVCSTLKGNSLVTHTWLAQSTGWLGSKQYKDYNIKQLSATTECIEQGSINGDPDESPNDNEGSFTMNQEIAADNILEYYNSLT